MIVKLVLSLKSPASQREFELPKGGSNNVKNNHYYSINLLNNNKSLLIFVIRVGWQANLPSMIVFSLACTLLSPMIILGFIILINFYCWLIANFKEIDL
ncbi:hypothetical protein BKH41_02910 [Helicobacter sp. 12S02232-10]|nr:hypothetical protein BKH41_02910 [Helicobacter sp. 12S02232-10]